MAKFDGKHIKGFLGNSENFFFRLFLPISILVPFVGIYAHFFFLVITAIDVGRGYWYFHDQARLKSDKDKPWKVTLNKFFYSGKMAANLVAMVAILTGSVLISTQLANPEMTLPTPLGFDMQAWLWFGHVMFIAGVIAPTAVRYLLKVFVDEQREKKEIHAEKTLKNFILGCTMSVATVGLALIFFKPEVSVEGGLMLGGLTLMVANMIPIFTQTIILGVEKIKRWPMWISVAVLDLLPDSTANIIESKQGIISTEDNKTDNARKAALKPALLPYFTSTVLLSLGLALVLNDSKKTFFLEGDMEHFNPSAGLGLLVIGFVIASAYEFYRYYQQTSATVHPTGTHSTDSKSRHSATISPTNTKQTKQ